MRVVKNIGRGGFGVVDWVQDENGNGYAQKTFAVNQAANYSPEMIENVRKRFIREARVQAQFNHPNIMPVLGCQLENDPPSFLMPVAQSSLDRDISTDRSMSGYALSAIMDILAGLEELHAVGIFHRDLKPQNVLRFEDGHGRPRYVIGDFGLMSVKDTQISLLTQTGMRMGSDCYTAPEIVSDLRMASAASDIYSVGCILHDLFGSDPGSRIPCSEIDDDAGHYSDIVRICTRRNPNKRFPSVAALREAILSIDVANAQNASAAPQVTDLISALQSDNYFSNAEWEQIVRVVRQLPPNEMGAVLYQLSAVRIGQVVNLAPDSAVVLCHLYADWVKSNSFNFELCDGLANRLVEFTSLDDFQCHVEIRLALLELGTSHNRWYVEHRFVQLCNHDMNEMLARRLAMEIRVMGDKACRMFSHLEVSISVGRDAFHPLVGNTLVQVCG